MATVNLLIYSSPVEGSQLFITYDTVLLTATGLVATCPMAANSDLLISYTLSGTAATHKVSRGSLLTSILFGLPIGVTIGTSSNGNPSTTFAGLTGYGGSHGIGGVAAVAIPG